MGRNRSGPAGAPRHSDVILCVGAYLDGHGRERLVCVFPPRPEPNVRWRLAYALRRYRALFAREPEILSATARTVRALLDTGGIGTMRILPLPLTRMGQPRIGDNAIVLGRIMWP